MSEAALGPDDQSQRIVLVVEDEILIRAVAAEALRDAGFTVIEAANGDEAMGLIEGGLIPHVLFTDVRMPGTLDGVQLARALRARVPSLPVFIASGHLNADADDFAPQGFLRKPYDISAVVSLIRKAVKD